MGDNPRYWAFLSYSHRDRRFGSWLHRAIETYRVPKSLVGGDVPARLHPVFRDREELAASSDLGDRLVEAIEGSRNLVVICSPAAAKSKWTNEEIIAFKKAHGDDHIFAAIVDGEPHASGMPGREAEECFPPALRFKIDDDGNITDIPAEPIAADFRPQGDGRKLAKLKLIAGMLGVPLDGLVQRDQQRRNRRLVWLSAASILGMAITTFLAIAAIQARDEARFQREEANGLVQFMLTDLRDKLEPVGRLDTLDVVGERALAYYEKQDLKDLSPDELGQRAAALNLVGEMANLQGDLDGALAGFREAARTTAEQLERFPDDPKRYFDHSQSSFWVGAIAFQRGENATAIRYFNDYLRMAERMVELEPDNETYRTELGYAHSNVAAVLQDEDKHAEALSHFRRSRSIESRLLKEDPASRDRKFSLAQTWAWESDSLHALGQFDAALKARRNETDLYAKLAAEDGDDYLPLASQVNSAGAQSDLLVDLGRLDDAQTTLDRVEPITERLLERDAANTFWREVVARYWVRKGHVALLARRNGEALSAIERARKMCDALVKEDPSVEIWRISCSANALWMRAVALHRANDDRRARADASRFVAEHSNAESMGFAQVQLGHAILAMLELAPRDLPKLLDQSIHQDDAAISALRLQQGLGGRRVGAYPIEKLIGP